MRRATVTGDARLDLLLARYRDEFWGGAPEAIEVEGICTAYAHELAEFLREHGEDAEVHYVEHPFELGYTDRTRIPAEDEGHAVVRVGLYLIDFTAAQYGYGEFPLVTRA